MRFVLGLFLAFLVNNAWADSLCNTHQVCKLDVPCECAIPADSGYSRYFYLDFPDLQKGHIYQCNLRDAMGMMSAVLSQSTFPVGSSWQLQSESPHFPTSIMIETNSMENSSDSAIIKYFVSASDIPNHVSATCITVA
jgi:hypothetical protein